MRTSPQHQRDPSIQSLPTAVLAHVVEYLSLADSCWSFEVTCSDLRRSRGEIETKRTLVRAHELSCLKACEILPSFELLRVLDLGNWATDSFLFAVESWSDHFPKLNHLSMVGSTVSTLSVLHHHPQLAFVDATYCNRIEHRDAVQLVQSLPTKGAVVRRIPEWMTGRIKTGFLNDGIHTYWQDGTFIFEGGRTGFVRLIRKLDETRMLLRLAFHAVTDHEGDERAVDVVQQVEHEVTLSPLTCDQDTSESRFILVAQSLTPPFEAPTAWPKPEHEDLPSGNPRFFGEENSDRVMVTKMEVCPLREHTPPLLFP